MTPLTCLAVAIFFEARAEPTVGMEAVANVINQSCGRQSLP